VEVSVVEIFLKMKSTIMNFGLREYLVLIGILLVGILCSGSRLSGWNRLAGHYPGQNRYQGDWISQPDYDGRDSGGVDVYLNHGLSEGAIRLGADAEGLYLSMSIVFRLFHPPLFVPWSDVRSEWVQGVPLVKKKNTLRITFAALPEIPLDVGRHIAGEMQKRAEGRWKMPEEE
jgi:hypothetical protein